MRDGEPNMYTALAMLRNGQTQLQWSRIQMLLGLNAIAIPIAFASNQTEQAKLVVSVVGLVIHFILIVAAVRASGWIDYWDVRIADLERLDSEEENPNRIRVQVFSRPEFESFKTGGKYLNRAFVAVGILFMLFWTWNLLRFLGFNPFSFGGQA